MCFRSTPKESRRSERKKGITVSISCNKAFLQSPDQYLQLELYFRSFPDTTHDISRLQMCLTIRPLPRAHGFSFVQVRHSCKTLTSGSQENFILSHLRTSTQTSGGSKCARLSAPSRGPLFRFPASKAFLHSPDRWLSPELYFRSFADTGPKIRRLETCSTIGPLLDVHYFSFQQVRHFCKATTSTCTENFILGHIITPHEMQSLQMCSTMRPLQGAHYFSSLQVRHFCKTPATVSHRNFNLGHLLTPT